MPPINDWSDIGALASVCSAIATVFIAVIVQSFSSRTARQQVRQNINDQLKAFNLAILQNPAFAEFTLKTRFPEGDPQYTTDFVRSLSVVHYRLNILSDIYYADRERVFCGARRQYQFTEWVRSLARSHAEALHHVLAGKMLVGHPARFMVAVSESLPSDFSDRERHIEAAKARLHAEGG